MILKLTSTIGIPNGNTANSEMQKNGELGEAISSSGADKSAEALDIDRDADSTQSRRSTSVFPLK